ncbi:MAG: FkbM family methyltransferase [Alphaproteobacteria bacterium]|nr:FkbM family methyltransferase [Alphaproteobacteria bacterium]
MARRDRTMNGGAELSLHWAELVDILRAQGVSLVFDVGANVGQYATCLRRSGYDGRIVSFEPLADAWDALVAAASEDADWDVAPRLAIGDTDGTATINRSAEPDMSSILEFDPEFLASSPSSAYVGREEVPIVRLDDVFEDYARAQDRVMIKVDTQGYERQVVAGCEGVIHRIAGFQLEMSLLPLYRGEATFEILFAALTRRGFAPHLFIPGYYSRHLKRQLQVDGVFFRP